jgi:hypothetical protein
MIKKYIFIYFFSLFIEKIYSFSVIPLKNIDIIFIPGSFIGQNKYMPLLSTLSQDLLKKNINSNIHYIDGCFKQEKIKNLKLDNYYFLAFSFGSFEASLLSQNNIDVNGLIQLCGSFNLNGDLPYSKTDVDIINCPSLSILGELDEKLPITSAITDKISLCKNKKMISVENMSHLSMFDTDKTKVSDIIANYINYIENNDQQSKSKIIDLENNTDKKFNKYLNCYQTIYSSRQAEKIQQKIIQNKNVYVQNYSLGTNIFETIAQIAFKNVETLLYICKFFPNFVTSYPKITDKYINISAFKPFRDSFYSYINIKKMTNSSLWLKLKKIKNEENIGKKICEEMLESMLQNFSNKELETYRKKPIIFENDINIGNYPFCSVVWLLTPISVKYTKNNVIVRCPVLQTTDDIPTYVKKIFGDKYINSLNLKILSDSQLLEWILVKCKYGYI